MIDLLVQSWLVLTTCSVALLLLVVAVQSATAGLRRATGRLRGAAQAHGETAASTALSLRGAQG